MDPGDIQEHFADGILSQSLRRPPSFLFHFSFPSLSPGRLLRTKYHLQKEKSKEQKCRVPGLFMAMPTENLGTCSSQPSTPCRFSLLPSDMHLSTRIGDGVSKWVLWRYLPQKRRMWVIKHPCAVSESGMPLCVCRPETILIKACWQGWPFGSHLGTWLLNSSLRWYYTLPKWYGWLTVPKMFYNVVDTECFLRVWNLDMC